MITDVLKTEMLEAHKGKDMDKVGFLRYLLAAIKNKEIELRPQNLELTDEVIIKVLKKQIKQRNDSIENFQKGNRMDLVAKETKEKEYLEAYIKRFAPEEVLQ